MGSNDGTRRVGSATPPETVSRWDVMRYYGCAVGVSMALPLLIAALLVSLLGKNPIGVLLTVVSAIIGSWQGFANTLFFMTSYIFTGLAFAIAFRGGLINVGAEGQLYVGALAAALTGIYCPNAGRVPLVLSILASASAGGLWGAVAAWLKHKFHVHEVLTTILLNFVALHLTGLGADLLRIPGDLAVQTPPIVEGARLPKVHELLSRIPLIGEPLAVPLRGTPLNSSFIIAVATALALSWLLYKTWIGYEIRFVGANVEAAAYAGIPVARVQYWTMFLSGAIAGLVGTNEVLGSRYRFLDQSGVGLGFTGIGVAILGGNHPLGVLPAAFFFAALDTAGLDINLAHGLPREFVQMLQATVVLTLISAWGWLRSRSS